MPIENIKSPADLLNEARENALNTCDTGCSTNIYEGWSKEAQQNISMGLYDQVTCEAGKSEISGALEENLGFIADIEALTSIEDINAYMAQLTHTPLSGGRS